MSRVAGFGPYAPALTIAAGQMPDPGAAPWLSHQDGVGGTDPTAALGHQTDGHDMDLAVVKLTVSVWDGMPGLEFIAERSHDPQGAAGSFGRIDPPVRFGPVAGQWISANNGVVVISSALGATPLILIVDAPAAARFRFGFGPSGAGNHALAALTATLETIKASVLA